MIQWDQHPTYDGQAITFRGTLLDDAVLSWETLSLAREGGYSNFSLSLADDHGHWGFILPPLQSESWILDHPGDTVAVVYQLDERAFTVIFLFPQALGSPSDYAVIVWGFRNETRNPSIGETLTRSDTPASAPTRIPPLSFPTRRPAQEAWQRTRRQVSSWATRLRPRTRTTMC